MRENQCDSSDPDVRGRQSEAARAEREATAPMRPPVVPGRGRSDASRRRLPLPKLAVHAPGMLNEATDYPMPASFARGLRLDLPGGVTHVMISGTASVGDGGETLYAGDFEAQCWRTYRNLSRLLENGGASWQDVVRCNCYLRDMARDYGAFNEIRTEFFETLGLDPLPASTAIEARLCRQELLVEIDLHAIFVREETLGT